MGPCWDVEELGEEVCSESDPSEEMRSLRGRVGRRGRRGRPVVGWMARMPPGGK